MEYFPTVFSILILFLKSYNSITTIQLYLISPDNDEFPFSLNKLKPAADLALQEIENLNILPNHRLKFVYFNSKCDPMLIYGELWKIMLRNCRPTQNLSFQKKLRDFNSTSSSVHGISGFFGPVCSYVLSTLARMNANIWKVPIITIGGFAQPFKDRNKPHMINEFFNFITRVGYNYQDPAELIMKMCVKYKWTEVVYISPMHSFDHTYDLKHCGLLGVAISAAADKLRNTGRAIKYDKSEINMTSFNESVRTIFTEKFKGSSIYLLCADHKDVKRILLMAQTLNLDNGEYVFINLDIFNDPSNLITPWKDNTATEEENQIAKKMFKHMFIVTLKQLRNEIYFNFSRRVKEIGQKRYNFTYKNEVVNNFVGAFYDSIILYANTLKSILMKGFQIGNGTAVSEAMINVTFMGISGNVTIDEIGDRSSEFLLLDMNPKNGKFRCVATFNGITNEFHDEFGEIIDWGNIENVAPPSTPICGYDNYKCIQKSNTLHYILISVFMVVLVCVVIIGIFIFRRAKFQAQLKAMNWLIPSVELESLESRYRRISKREIMADYIPFIKATYKKRKPKISRNGNSSREFLFENNKIIKIDQKVSLNNDVANTDLESIQSTLSIDSIDGIKFNNCKLYGCTAVYKGAVVALKLIKREKRIEKNRDLLLEVKKVKDLNYDHVCRFIGACLDSNEQYIVYEYCSKGSLKDILAQKQLDLDWMFKYSLIQDICRGMIYIHQNIGPHGNLKSSNCVVDSRFVLKITDFGCPTLRGGEKPISTPSTNEDYFKSLLWTSPERLRSANPFGNVTFKADVYSFSIICQEVIYRKGPFYIECKGDITAEEKILEVKKFRPVPFRPSIYAVESCTEEFIKIVNAAWSDDPSGRPDFVAIKAAMRKLNKSGDTGNILDNLLSRMEQYANNLEGLVAKKTEQYLDEKKRAETLLYSMLPRSVAEQLILKQDCIAESYESVTIYFSDIVGFTSLSAESTPMEVVLLLNKLYTTFDKILELFDVYKVETIGDAYVVCSGLPTRNENKHAGEICRMAIAFLSKLFTFIIPHRPNTQLKLRIGIHSGPVCAGVVGVKMPRYCLFGDTVNTSSRMESSGLPQKIHISESTKNILCSIKNFVITERGLVEMKGKGKQRTYWLHGEGDTIVDEIPLGALLVSYNSF